MPRARLDVDGVAYDLDYLGHDQSLAAWTADGEPIRLAPWRLDQHLVALGHATRVHGDDLVLDAAAYAAHVLGDADAVARWGPLALWWAAGAVADGARMDHAVRAWSVLERASAVQAALDPDTGAFDVGRFLTRLVTDCVPCTEVPDPLALPLLRGAPLLAAACRACAPEPLLPPALADPALRRLTLHLCKTLGWTPAQVWRAPVDEVDRLLALLERAEAETPRQAPRISSLAGQAGTHTLHFD